MLAPRPPALAAYAAFLLAAPGFQDFTGNFGSFDERGPGGKTIAVTVQNHLAERNFVAGRSREFFDGNGISRANPILLTSRPNNGV